ncbi:MAG: dihydroorotate dehydrogenase electron transfer subunit [Dehalococcoidia bacterium]|nr:dihydroorotate dehydrogenase electron transfer subunit [Dehalococcoidia bacterium]
MKVFGAEIVSNEEVAPGLRVMWLRTPQLGQVTPGQFFMARCGPGIEPLLRRPLSIHRIGNMPAAGSNTGDLGLLYDVYGSETSALLDKEEGDELDVIGPLGRGFSVHKDSKSLLLIASGLGISPMVALADVEVKRGRSVVLLAGAPTSSSVYPPDLLPAEIEVQIATEDGSQGRHGSVIDLVPEFWEWADEVFCSGPMDVYRGVEQIARGYGYRKRVQALADVGMACGIGACYGCTVWTRQGAKLACKDGRCFNLRDLLLS